MLTARASALEEQLRQAAAEKATATYRKLKQLLRDGYAAKGAAKGGQTGRRWVSSHIWGRVLSGTP